MNILKYNSIIFDCDGVLINSNKIKTQAFYEFALPFGKSFALKFKNFHVENGGVSRYEKIKHLYEKILKKKIDNKSLKSEAKRYGELISKKILNAEISTGLNVLRKNNKHACWSVVSGGDQEDLRELFKKNGLVKFFDENIFGSPRSKSQIIIEEAKNILKCPVLFIGDSKYDMDTADQFDMDFIFLKNWSEWDLDVVPNDLICFGSIKDLAQETSICNTKSQR